jgi:hypothetical protein
MAYIILSLKFVLRYLFVFFYFIFNLRSTQQNFPVLWKQEYVFPVFKKDSCDLLVITDQSLILEIFRKYFNILYITKVFIFLS